MAFARRAAQTRSHRRGLMHSSGAPITQAPGDAPLHACCVQTFHASFKRCRYDLMRWRTISSLTEQQTAVLDANGGAGWELAAALLRPRKVQVHPRARTRLPCCATPAPAPACRAVPPHPAVTASQPMFPAVWRRQPQLV